MLVIATHVLVWWAGSTGDRFANVCQLISHALGQEIAHAFG